MVKCYVCRYIEAIKTPCQGYKEPNMFAVSKVQELEDVSFVVGCTAQGFVALGLFPRSPLYILGVIEGIQEP